MNEAKISEIFVSYQGEGPYMGVKQLFVRFFGCSYNCNYCDTRFDKYVTHTYASLMEEIAKYSKDDYHSISVTGGEPLEQADFLAEWFPMLKSQKKIIYLETNGMLDKELEKVIRYVDIIAMDIKIPSSTGREPKWEEHKRFLELAKTKEVFVKVVVTWDSTQNDIIKARDIVKNINSKIKLILQPVDQIGKIKEPSRDYLTRFRKIIEQGGISAKVIPQQHKQWGVK